MAGCSAALAASSGLATARGSRAGGARSLYAAKGAARVTMMAKKGIHPEFFPEAKILLNGEEVVRMGGTRAEYNVDIWSGNHPFYQGNTGSVVIDEDQVNRFLRRFGTIGVYGKPAVLAAGKAAPAPEKKAAAGKAKGKK